MSPKRRHIVRRRPVEEVEVEEEEELEELDDLVEEDELEDLEEEEEEVRTPKKFQSKSSPAVTKKVAPVEEELPAKPKIKKVDTVVAEDVLTKILEGMEIGKTVAISRTADNRWELALVDGKSFAATGKLTGRAFWDEVTSPEFKEWNEMWGQMTFDEKKKAALKAGAKWEPHENPKVEVMRITEAYREHMGVEKYKPQYASRAARAAIRG